MGPEKKRKRFSGNVRIKKEKIDSKSWDGWAKANQPLKDVIIQKGYYDPTPEQLVEIAEILQSKYLIHGVDAEKIRGKLRGVSFKKWLKTKKRKKESVSGKPIQDSSSEEYPSEIEESFNSSESETEEEKELQIVPYKKQFKESEEIQESTFWNMDDFTAIPSQYKMAPATVLQTDETYYISYRTDLGSQVFPTIVNSFPTPVVLLEIRSDPSYAEEIGRTQAWKDPKISMPRMATRVGWVPIPLLPNIILGKPSRFDYDTSFGRLFELVIPKVNLQTTSLAPPLNQIKQQDKARTETPLHKTNESTAASS